MFFEKPQASSHAKLLSTLLLLSSIDGAEAWDAPSKGIVLTGLIGLPILVILIIVFWCKNRNRQPVYNAG